MKTIFNISSVLVLSIIVFASCESVENPAPINSIDTTRTATIRGIVRADLDTDEAGFESAPAGTKIFIDIDSRDYATSTTGGNYQQLLFETTVDANGEFEIEVPALARFITANIRGENFVTDQRQGGGNTERRLYNDAEGGVNFIENETYFVNLTYDDTSFE